MENSTYGINPGDIVICVENNNPKYPLNSSDANGKGWGWKLGRSFKVKDITPHLSGAILWPDVGNGFGIYLDFVRKEMDWDL